MLQTNRLRSWLAGSEHAEGWRRYLLLNVLETQATRGWYADPAAIAQIHQRFTSNHPGLNHPYFALTGEALAAHAAELNAPVAGGADAIAAAADAYQPVDRTRLEREVGRLREEIAFARQFYGERATAESDSVALLKLAELDELLGRLDLATSVARAESDDTIPTSRAGRTRSSTHPDKVADLRELQSHLVNFNHYASTMTDRTFPIVHRHLTRVTFQYGQFADSDPRGVFDRRLNDLQQSYQRVRETGDQTAQAELALTLGWFDVTGQAPDLVRSLRRELMQPNVRFTVASRFIREVAKRPVAPQQRPVDENILGRRILGTACVMTDVHLDLIEDPNQAHISIHLEGTITSNNYTRQGPVTAYSNSQSPVEGRRSILANVGGLIEYAPYVAVNTNSSFGGVDCIPLVERIAYKQYLQDKDASEAIAARRTENRLINEFGQETSEAIQNGKVRLREAMHKNQGRLSRIGSVCVHTSNSHLHGFGVQADTFQLAAITPPIQVSADQDVVVQVHESALDNYLEPYLARQTVRNTEIAGKIEQILGRPPENFADQSGENWSITFPPSRPIQVLFADQRIAVTLIGNRFTRDDQRIDEPMAIRVNLKVVNDRGTTRFVRDGKISVDFVRDVVPPVSVTAFRSFLEDVLNKSVQDQEGNRAEATDQPGQLQLTDNLLPLDRFEDPRIAQDMKLTVFRAENGWLTAAWQYMPGLADAVRSGYQYPANGVDTPLLQPPPSE